jgi:Zn-dependent oligopeptidase
MTLSQSLQKFALDWTPTAVADNTAKVIEKAEQETKSIANGKSLDFEDTFHRLHLSEAEVAQWSCLMVLGSMVHTKLEIRNACNTAKTKIKEFLDGRFMRKDLFEILKRVDLSSVTEPLKKRLAVKTLELFERNGVSLPADKSKRLSELRAQISELETTFQKNLGEDQTFALYSKAELTGCPRDFVEGLEKVDGLYKVSTKPPHMRTLFELCSVEETRKKQYVVAQGRCSQNAELLAELVKSRSEAASILGYKNWNEYKLRPTMAGSEGEVWKLLKDLTIGLSTKLDSDFDKLKKIKGSETLNLWDISFLEKKYLKEENGLDEEKLKQYLPMDYCVRRVMQVYEYLFNIKFNRIDDRSLTWHDDVLLYAVTDGAETSKTLGYFFLDFYSRPGKYAHQCVLPLSPCFVGKDGDYVVPVVANISNLSSKSTSTKHSTLSHGELTTFFHEFGHAVHAICTNSPYSMFSWSWNAVPYAAGVEMDFLEVPSKCFENWGWEKDVLKRATFDSTKLPMDFVVQDEASKPKESQYPLPDEMIERVQKTKFLFAGYDYRRMAFMTAFDLLVHGLPYKSSLSVEDKNALEILPEKNLLTLEYSNVTGKSLLQLWTALQKHIVKMDTVPNTNPLACWYHLAMGYDSGYYGYLYSEGIAADIYETMFEKECLSRESGLKLREKVLQMGAKDDALNFVSKTLGRKPDVSNLIKRLLK